MVCCVSVRSRLICFEEKSDGSMVFWCSNFEFWFSELNTRIEDEEDEEKVTQDLQRRRYEQKHNRR